MGGESCLKKFLTQLLRHLFPFLLLAYIYLIYLLQIAIGIDRHVASGNIYTYQGGMHILFIVITLLKVLAGVLLGVPTIADTLSYAKSLGMKVRVTWKISVLWGIMFLLLAFGIEIKWLTLEVAKAAPMLYACLIIATDDFVHGFCAIAAGYLFLPSFEIEGKSQGDGSSVQP